MAGSNPRTPKYLLPGAKLSVAEPVTELKAVPIIENNEKLVDVVQECPKILLDLPRFHYRRETYLRESVAVRLCRAATRLPNGYTLLLIEGWRAPHIQHRMYLAVWNRFAEAHPDWSASHLKKVVNRFSAPMNPSVPPPHITGGALDISLGDAHGNPVDLRSPYEWRDSRGYLLKARGLSAEAERNRMILHDALAAEDITNYPAEFWHYSHGDQGWAYRGSHPAAKYGPIEPDNFSPPAEDLVDEPLVFNEAVIPST